MNGTNEITPSVPLWCCSSLRFTISLLLFSFIMKQLLC